MTLVAVLYQGPLHDQRRAIIFDEFPPELRYAKEPELSAIPQPPATSPETVLVYRRAEQLAVRLCMYEYAGEQ